MRESVKVEGNVTESQYEELSKKLDLLTRLTALSLITDREPPDQFILLGKAGFQPKEIAEIVGATAKRAKPRSLGTADVVSTKFSTRISAI